MLIPARDHDLAEEECGDANTNVCKLHVSTKTSQHATRDPTTQQQGWRFGPVSPWRLDDTLCPGKTSTVHGCLVRQEGCGWPDTTTTTNKSMAHFNMVVEQELTYGLVERAAWLLFVNISVMTEAWRVDCAWTVAALGRAESSRVDLVTEDLDVYRINAVVENLQQELGVCRDPWTIAGCFLRSGERWLVLEMLLEVDLSSRPRVPEFMVTWV